jgi:hypothetical protein
MKKVVGKILLLIAIICISRDALSKPRYMALDELVAVSDFIGVIQVDSSETVGHLFDPDLPIKRYNSYSQKNLFNVIDIIKSSEFIDIEMNRTDTLWAGESFICAQAYYRPGLYLVFLENMGPGEWVNFNYQRGAIRIENDSVEFGWYIDPRRQPATISLAEAEKNIRGYLLDSPVFEFEIDVYMKHRYNEWREDREYQKIYYPIYNPSFEFWPDGLRSLTGFFIKTDRDQYEYMTQSGSNYYLSVHWVKGYLVIDSVKPKE